MEIEHICVGSPEVFKLYEKVSKAFEKIAREKGDVLDFFSVITLYQLECKRALIKTLYDEGARGKAIVSSIEEECEKMAEARATGMPYRCGAEEDAYIED